LLGQTARTNANTEVKGIKYFVPLSSFKDNHKQMKEGVDFMIVYSHKKHNGVSTPLAKRTNDFDMLEKLCKEY